jgi:hypothetical protein
LKNELDEKLKQIRKEGRRYRENIRRHFMDLLHDIFYKSDGTHPKNQAGMATGESRGTSRKGTEGRGKEKGKTTD